MPQTLAKHNWNYNDKKKRYIVSGWPECPVTIERRNKPNLPKYVYVVWDGEIERRECIGLNEATAFADGMLMYYPTIKVRQPTGEPDFDFIHKQEVATEDFIQQQGLMG